MIQNIRVGIPIVGTQEWSGGVSYIELLIKAVNSLPQNERPRLSLIVTDNRLSVFNLHQSVLPLVDDTIFLGQDIQSAKRIIGESVVHISSYNELFEKIDFYFPVLVSVLPPNLCAASWIPDFQYVHLKQFFSEEEIQNRAASARSVAENARLLVLSSHDVKKDFESQFPHSKAIIRILSFHSLPVDTWYQEDAVAVQKKYDLPDEFMICCNQFWMHKNHIRLFEAIAKLRKEGTEVHVVCTGNTEDHRSRNYFQEIQKNIAALHIQDLIHILGYIPRNDRSSEGR